MSITGSHRTPCGAWHRLAALVVRSVVRSSHLGVPVSSLSSIVSA